jgi:hypothetical protein
VSVSHSTKKAYAEALEKFCKAGILHEVNGVKPDKRAFRFTQNPCLFLNRMITERPDALTEQSNIDLVDAIEFGRQTVLPDDETWTLFESWGVVAIEQDRTLVCWPGFESVILCDKEKIAKKETSVKKDPEDVPPVTVKQKYLVYCISRDADTILSVLDGTLRGRLGQCMSDRLTDRLREKGILKFEGTTRWGTWSIDQTIARACRFTKVTTRDERSKVTASANPEPIAWDQWLVDLQELSGVREKVPASMVPAAKPQMAEEKPVEPKPVEPTQQTGEPVVVTTEIDFASMSDTALAALEVTTREQVAIWNTKLEQVLAEQKSREEVKAARRRKISETLLAIESERAELKKQEETLKQELATLEMPK